MSVMPPRRCLPMVLTACLLLMPAAVQAHSPFALEVERLPLWLAAVGMAVAWLLYLRGARLRPAPAPARGCFHAGMLIAVLAVFGPLDHWAETNTAMHMLQHMLFMVVIAPLWALAGPLPQWHAAVGGRGRPLWRGLVLAGRQPAACATLHGVTVWVWHVPLLYVLALENAWVHALEHAAFLFTAWLFWWSALRASGSATGAALVAVGVTLMHTGLLGALLTFATVSFYGPERSVTEQQLAGLLMWVPGSLFYLAAAGWMSWRWLQRGARSSRLRADRQHGI